MLPPTPDSYTVHEELDPMALLRACGLVVAPVLGAALSAQTHFPSPPVPAGNPITTQKALLGMSLFWDEQMSSTNTVACGTCHVFASGGVDPRGTRVHPGYDGVFGTADDVRAAAGVPASNSSGHYTGSQHFGIEPQVTRRKAPSVINAAYQPTLFYDGRAQGGQFRDPVTNAVVLTGEVALENVIKEPPLSPVEMGHAGRTWTEVADKIAAARPLALASNVPARLQAFLGSAANYNELFAVAYGPGATATPQRIIMAIATYLRTLVSDQTRYDQHLAGQTTLTAQELRGLQEFSNSHGTAAACIQCHGDLQSSSHQFGPSPLLTTPYGQMFSPNSHNTGIRPIAEDPGVGVVTSQQFDQGRFRVPGLRNTVLHGSWFHTGGLRSLTEVVEFYDRGGDFHVNQATEIQPMNLTAYAKADLEAFLNTLVDPRVANEQAPFDRPQLASETGLAPTVFGTGTVGSTGVATTAMAIEPVTVGGRATIAVHNARPNTAGFVLWDTVSVQQGFTYAGVHLYLGLYEFSLTYAGQTQALANGRGFASHPIRVPSNPSLSGFELFAQWLVIDPASPAGVASSDAISLRVH
jgi:cytochrome c peroxidase